MLNQWIDIHSHILPTVDDGSVSIQQTRRMLEIANAEGIGHIITTPHYRTFGRNTEIDELQRKLTLVQEEARNVDANFKVELGNELYYSDEIIEHLKSKKALTLANTRYVLVEFLVSESFKNIRSGLYRFFLQGYIPILAHLERYECFYDNSKYVKELIELGVFMQMNISSLLGSRIDRNVNYCRKLLRMGYIHFLGTDSHSDQHRAPRMKEGAEFIRKQYGSELVTRLLINNPTNLLLDQPIDM